MDGGGSTILLDPLIFKYAEVMFNMSLPANHLGLPRAQTTPKPLTRGLALGGTSRSNFRICSRDSEEDGTLPQSEFSPSQVVKGVMSSLGFSVGLISREQVCYQELGLGESCFLRKGIEFSSGFRLFMGEEATTKLRRIVATELLTLKAASRDVGCCFSSSGSSLNS